MSDLKSKIPDLDELGAMASKLYKGIRESIDEIVVDYKKKHLDEPDETPKVAKSKSSDEKEEKK